MEARAAEVAVELRTPLVLTRFRRLSQQRCGGHDDSASCVAALRHLLLDKGCLDRVRPCRGAKSFERGDQLVLRVGDGYLAGGRRVAVADHGASAALAETAAVFCCR